MSRTRHHGDKQKEIVYGRHWLWYRSTPSWWNRLFHTKPRRAEERQRLKRAEKGDVEQVWPLSQKPHHYYW